MNVESFHSEKPSEFGIRISFNSTFLDSRFSEACSAITLTSILSHVDGRHTPIKMVRI